MVPAFGEHLHRLNTILGTAQGQVYSPLPKSCWMATMAWLEAQGRGIHSTIRYGRMKLLVSSGLTESIDKWGS